VHNYCYNITFALVFNLLAIAASAMGYLNPVMGALAHNIGSVLVVLNSAQLIRKRFGQLSPGVSSPAPGGNLSSI